MAHLPSFHSGGLLWFTDLGVADPYIALPLLTAGTMLAMIELGSQEGAWARGAPKWIIARDVVIMD